MGYDLHITRAEFWIYSEQVPISLAEWQAYVANRDDVDVSPGGTHFALMLPDGIEILM